VKRLARAVCRYVPTVAVASVAVVLAVLIIDPSISSQQLAAAPPAEAKLLDPAAWGSDHVGEPVPLYMEGGECLFCHRHQVGVTWDTNKHNRTIRDAEPKEPAMVALREDESTKTIADEVELLMGDSRAQRFLKRAKAYGHADMLTVKADFGRGRRARLEDRENPKWDTEVFAKECAGCHTTAVDPETHAFATVSLDCYACHGDAPAEHANEPELMALAKARKDSPAAVMSICGSCHIRFGKSKTTGLPYPTNFVAGDNLFKDFEVDWSVLDDEKLNPADAHVMDNIRAVVIEGNESMTCLSCHEVHPGTSAKHRELPVVQYCQHCHTASDPIRGHKTYSVHSERCEY
jgi:hypothetical protein